MEYKPRSAIKDTWVTHLLVAVAVGLLFGIGAYYRGFPTRTILMIVLVVVLLAFLLVPWVRRKQQP
jgi:Flp pilus assembly protein TadB